jgi:ankyrin repeat protein/tRNA A-37 threonylcarbamoyl transferase component Bud32
MSTERLDNEGTVRLDNNQNTARLDDNTAANKLDISESIQQFDIMKNTAGTGISQPIQFIQDTASGQIKPDNIFAPGQVIQLRGKDYTIESLISENSGEAVIYKVTRNDKPFVFKYYKKNCRIPENVMAKIQENPQDRIIRVYDFGRFNEQDFEIMEYAEGGALDDCLNENGPIRNIEKLKEIVGQIAEGLNQLHNEHRIIYQDLKPENIYFKDKERTSLVLADFGISSVMPPGKNEAEVRADVTTVYAAPELARKGNETYATIDPLVDYFALGITMLHIWLGETPFKDITPSARDKMIRDKDVTFPQDMPADYRTLIQGLIDPLPKSRWRNQQIEVWLSGKSLHGDYQKTNINYKSQMFKENESYASPAELAELMDRDHARGTAFLYDGTVASWLEKAGDRFLAEEIKSIVSAYPDDKEAGLYRAVYTLDPSRIFITHGGKKCANDSEIANALMAESGYYMEELKNNKNALFYLNILATGGNNGKTVVEKFQKYFEEYTPKRAVTLIYLFLTDSEGITIGSKIYSDIEEIAAETDSRQIEAIKQAVQEADSLFLVWLCEHYNAYFSSTEDLMNLPVWNRFFLFSQFPFLSYKELITNWEKQSLNDLCALAYCVPGRFDLFETYARQGLPFKGQAENIDIRPTPLCCLAANFNNADVPAGLELVRFLHKNGADINERSGDGSLPLVLAISQRNVPLTKLLLELGADPDKTHNYAPLLWAIFQNEDGEKEQDRIAITYLLLEHKANVNVAHNDNTPLFLSLSFETPEKVELVSRLLTAGANVNRTNSMGASPLLQSIYVYSRNNNQNDQKNMLEVIELLLKKGAKTDALTKEGNWSPLMLAANNNHLELAELLLKNGAKKDFADADGYTAFVYAKRANNHQIAQLLDPGKTLIKKSILFSAVKITLSALAALWVFLTMDALARVVLSLHLIYPLLLGASILASHLLTAYLLIIIHGFHEYLLKLRGTFNFVGSGLFYVFGIPVVIPLIAALLHGLTKLLPESVTTALSLPAEFLMRPSSGFAVFLLYIAFLALFMGAVLFFSKVTRKFNRLMNVYRQFS